MSDPSSPASWRPPGGHPLPSALARQARWARLGRPRTPALLAHPDWAAPAPVLVWMHGRTVDKTLDNGRYLRLIRAGIAVCAVDLPGHGERLDPAAHDPRRTLEVIGGMVEEIDEIIEALAEPEYAGVFDLERLAIGGMSAGGMAALRRLCDPHPFRAAAVESTAGDLALLYGAGGPAGSAGLHPAERIGALSAAEHLATWRPVPLLALHSEADAVVPVACMARFVEALRRRYALIGADPAAVVMKTWASTGAPDEHAGFGRVAAEAKTLHVDFLAEHLSPARRG